MTSRSAQPREPRKIHFVSLGCPKNRVDTEVMVGVALNGQAGDFVLTNDAEEAEVIVVNTCGFIGEAKKESIDTIFEMAGGEFNTVPDKLRDTLLALRAMVRRRRRTDATPAMLRETDLSEFGTRHWALMRYCHHYPGSLGFSVSQDGNIQAMTRIGDRLVLWENIDVQLTVQVLDWQAVDRDPPDMVRRLNLHP